MVPNPVNPAGDSDFLADIFGAQSAAMVRSIKMHE